MVATAGHGGPVQGATFLEGDNYAGSGVIVVTSGGGGDTDGCSVAARFVKDRKLRWRRDVCVHSKWSSSSTTPTKSRAALVVVIGGEGTEEMTVVTLDRDDLVLRGWQGTSGNLLFDVSVQREVDDDDDGNNDDDVQLYAVSTD